MIDQRCVLCPEGVYKCIKLSNINEFEMIMEDWKTEYIAYLFYWKTYASKTQKRTKIH